jgi:hypothetical protein
MKGKGVRIGFFGISFCFCDGRGHRKFAVWALKQKDVNERFGASAHGSLHDGKVTEGRRFSPYHKGGMFGYKSL